MSVHRNTNVALTCMCFMICASSFAMAEQISPQAINDADAQLSLRASIAKLQILLDRSHFSPGVIDGRMGDNVKRALRAFREAKSIKEDESPVGEATQAALGWKDATVIAEHDLTHDDVKGLFSKIPSNFEAKRKLDHLGYTSPAEEVAEKFHMDEDFLKELNPGADFGRGGSTIEVADVQSSLQDLPAAKRLEVDKSENQLLVMGDNDQVVAAFPATVGSTERPAPTGQLTIKGVAENPIYTYSPDLAFAGVDAKTAFTIAAGPNNPVGNVWIDLSEDGFGIHGTPEPSEVGKTASHGCVRLTNWDAETLASMVKPGMKVLFH